MTYEEYKSNKLSSNKNKKSNNFFKKLLSKFLTIVIFVMIVLIASNFSSKFRNFLINDVLNNTMDFSKVNKLVNKVTSIFKTEENDDTLPVANIDTKTQEKYLDGVKYFVGENEEIKLKDSGIVTFIGEKEGYNNTIIIQQSNGYYAWYGNIKESVKLYDYLEKGTTIGSASNEYYFVLYKDGKVVNEE